MRESDAEQDVEMNVTEYEFELVSAFREIRDSEVAQMISELVHVLSISQQADVIPLAARKAVGLTIAGGTEVALTSGAMPRELIDA